MAIRAPIIPSALTLIVAVFSSSLPSPSLAELMQGTDGSTYITVDDPRPVLKAVDELSKVYGYLISYEDPRYAYDGDLQDVTDQVRRNDAAATPGVSPHRVLVPLGGTLEFRAESFASTNRLTVMGSLAQRVVDTQALRGSGGRFQIERSANMLHVVPTEVRSKSGEWIAQSSILTTTIEVPSGKHTGQNMVDAITAAVSSSTGESVLLASAPLNLLRQEKNYPALYGPAREVLLRALQTIDSRLTWKLLYAPDFQKYYLNLVIVPQVPKAPSTPVSPPVGSDTGAGALGRKPTSR